MALDEYRTIDVYIDDSTQWLPDVTVNGGDLDGTKLRAILTDKGADAAADGLTARMVFNAGDEGDFRDMDAVDGQPTATFETTIPRGAMKPGLTRMAVQLLNADRTQIISSRAFSLRVETPVLRTDDTDGMKAFEQYAQSAQTAERNAKEYADQAKTAQASADTSAATAQTAADSAQKFAATATERADAASKSAAAAYQSETTANGWGVAAGNHANDALVSKMAASDSAVDAQAHATAAQESARDAENSAGLARQYADGIDITIGDVAATDPGSDPEVTKTGEHGNVTLAFKLPRGEAGPPSLYLANRALDANDTLTKTEVYPSVDTGTAYPLVKGGVVIDTTGAAFPITSVSTDGNTCTVGARVDGFRLGANTPIATQSTAGAIIVGAGLTIDGDGVLSANGRGSGYDLVRSNATLTLRITSTGFDAATRWNIIHGAGINTDGDTSNKITIPWSELGLAEGESVATDTVTTGNFNVGAVLGASSKGLSITPDEQHAGSMVTFDIAVQKAS